MASRCGGEACLALVYAGSLGLDEACADLLIKAWSGVLALCDDDGESDHEHGGGGDCTRSWVLWVSLGLWILSAFASAFWWYRKVLRRFETTGYHLGGFLKYRDHTTRLLCPCIPLLVMAQLSRLVVVLLSNHRKRLCIDCRS